MTAFLFSELFPIQMEGVKLTVNKGLSNHFQVSLPGTLNPPEVIPAIPLHLCTYNPLLLPKGLGLVLEKTQRHSARLTTQW